MSIRVGKYNYRSKIEPTTDGYTNILIHTTGSLSPYVMTDSNGVIMENYWQFSKIWKNVQKIKQPISQYNPDSVRWEYPSEQHMIGDKVTPQYWNWREKGFNSTLWVRYPNGYNNHSKAVGSVIGTPDNYEIVDYITARKKLYYPKYREIAIKTVRFKSLLKKLHKGQNLQINEVDGPRYSDEYPYNLTVNESIEINETILKDLINNPAQAFGHGYSLAAALLGIEKFD